MTNYTKTTNFATKDTLPSGNANKIVKGTEIDTEFNNIATAVATKADTAGPTLTGTTTFETLSDGTISITAFVDEDNMASDSATLLPTQQSVKAYVDSQVTAQDLDFQADSGGALSIDLDSETLTFTGGTGVDTSGSGNAVTFAIDSTVATLTGSQTLTNKTLTSPTLNTPTIGTSFTIGSATITEAELEILDGATVTTAELNVLDGITSTTAELNILDGVTSTAAELNILDGVTATAAELNILDGVTSTTAELNILDGVTSTTAELNILDGVTATTAELNYVDGVTSAIQTQIDAKAPLASPTFTGTVTATNGVFSGFVDFKTGGVVRGNIYSDSSTMIINTQGTNTTLNTNGGNVGIGTSSPNNTLSILGSVNQLDIETSTTGVTLESIDRSDVAAQSDLSFYARNGEHKFFGSAYTERMRINSSGNLLLQQTSAAVYDGNTTGDVSNFWKMSVSGSSTNTRSLVGSNSTGGIFGGARLNSGNTRPIITSFMEFSCPDTTAGAETGEIYFYTKPSGGVASSTKRMVIDSSGNLLIGTTAQSYSEKVSISVTSGSQGITIAQTDNANAHDKILFTNTNGIVGYIRTTGTTTAYATSSDYRLKENVVAMTGATARLKQLNPSRFNFIADADVTVDGFLAHEVQDIVPEAITGTKDAVDDDGNAVYQGIDQSKLVPLLVATIQELETRITQLENN